LDIGAGQADLAAGRLLQQHGLRFLILDEKAAPGENWRNYYDSLQPFAKRDHDWLIAQAATSCTAWAPDAKPE